MGRLNSNQEVQQISHIYGYRSHCYNPTVPESISSLVQRPNAKDLLISEATFQAAKFYNKLEIPSAFFQRQPFSLLPLL